MQRNENKKSRRGLFLGQKAKRLTTRGKDPYRVLRIRGPAYAEPEEFRDLLVWLGVPKRSQGWAEYSGELSLWLVLLEQAQLSTLAHRVEEEQLQWALLTHYPSDEELAVAVELAQNYVSQKPVRNLSAYEAGWEIIRRNKRRPHEAKTMFA